MDRCLSYGMALSQQRGGNEASSLVASSKILRRHSIQYAWPQLSIAESTAALSMQKKHAL